MTKSEEKTSPLSTILVPTDFSDCSRSALKQAERLAKALGEKILLVHVIDPVSYYVSESLQWADLYERFATTVQPLLNGLIQEVEKESLEISAELVQGAPYQEIVRKAEEVKVDLIVMGTHGRTGLPHFFLGSVAVRVLRMAPCPVLTVK